MIYNLSNPEERKMLKKRLDKYTEKGLTVDFKKRIKKRSLAQNAYLHVIISLFAIECGWTISEAKTFLKRSCGFMVYEKNRVKFLKETRGMDSQELTTFIEWILIFCEKQGLLIPSSEDYLESQDSFDNTISKHNQHLHQTEENE